MRGLWEVAVSRLDGGAGGQAHEYEDIDYNIANL